MGDAVIPLHVLLITQSGHAGGRTAIELPDGRILMCRSDGGMHSYSSRAVMEKLYPGLAFQAMPEAAQRVMNIVQTPDQVMVHGALP